jgi:hypothetical protein
MSDNEHVRRALLERLATLGMCADVRNDDDAVRKVSAQLGLSVPDVAKELAGMRGQGADSMFRILGVAKTPQRFLAGLVATRHVAGQQAEAEFMARYRKHSQQTTEELIDDLGQSFDDKEEQRRRRLVHETERP